MKYIRTKDGKIFSVLVSDQVSKDEVAMDIIGFRIQTALKQNKCIAKKDNILKIADTIEELCDEFIWTWNEKEYPYSTARQHVRYSFGELKREMRDQLNYGKNINLDYIIFGAIWTDKGLIYVAKLNEKGELELI